VVPLNAESLAAAHDVVSVSEARALAVSFFDN
jgi:hypothetical protein